MKTAGRLIASLAMLAVSADASSADEPTVKDAATAKAILREYIGPGAMKAGLAERIGKLVRDLGADRWRDRDSATRALLGIGPKAKPWVRDALRSPDTEVRTRAEQILKALQTLEGQQGTVATEAADLLAKAKDKWVIDALLRLLGHDSLELRYAAEYGLRRLTGKCFRYNAYAAEAPRAAAAEKWQAWWTQNRQSFDFQSPADRGKPSGVMICDSTAREIQWISLDGKLLWSKSWNSAVEPYCAQPLLNGNTFIALRVQEKTFAAEYGAKGNVLVLKGAAADIQRLPNGNTLMTDPTGANVREIDPTGKKVVWEHASGIQTTCMERLASGNTLVVNTSAGRVIEVNRAGQIVWSQMGLASPRNVTKLANGNVLIIEHGRRRILELDREGNTVWTFPAGSGYPVSACRVGQGRTMIYDQTRGLVLVDMSGKILKTLSRLRPRHYEKIRLTPPGYQPPSSKKKS